jgi:hypothetical protein
MDGSIAILQKIFLATFILAQSTIPSIQMHIKATQMNIREVHHTKVWPWAYRYLTQGQQWIHQAVVDLLEEQRPTFLLDEALKWSPHARMLWMRFVRPLRFQSKETLFCVV